MKKAILNINYNLNNFSHIYFYYYYKKLMDKTKTKLNENILKIENTKNEIVGIFDENDNYIGKDTRKNMRKNNLIHRCTCIMIINNKKQILVQTRALTKEYFLDILLYVQVE